MSHEAPRQRPVMLEDGSLNSAYINETWGISTEFAQQKVTFDMGEQVFTGTVAEMLADTKCPVGGRLQQAFEKKGIEGVVSRFENLVEDWGAEFEEGVELSVETIASEDVKKNRQIFPSL